MGAAVARGLAKPVVRLLEISGRSTRTRLKGFHPAQRTVVASGDKWLASVGERRKIGDNEPVGKAIPHGRDEDGTELPDDQPATSDLAKYGPFSRAFAAVICGVVAGMLIPGALANGCLFFFPEERLSGTPWLFLWGEHWAIMIRFPKVARAASPLPAVIARGKARFSAEELREMAGIGVAEKKSWLTPSTAPCTHGISAVSGP